MVKLDRLITILGTYGARLLGTADREVELRSVALHDPVRQESGVGDIFLAVGVPTVSEAIRLARQARAVVLVVRTTEEPAPDPDGMAVLVADPSVSWSQVAGVVYGLVLEGRETESGRGPADLSALADTIAAAVGGPVTIEDQLSRVMAYSSEQREADPARHDTILGRRVPDRVRALFERQGVFTHLARSDEPLFVPASPEHGLHGRSVVAVRAGRELLGSVWVSCTAPLDAARARILTDGARTVALHLLRWRVSADLERQVESELVIQLLEGDPDADAVIRKLGLPASGLRVVAVQAHTEAERNAGLLLAFERATTGFGWSRVGRSTLFGNTVYTVLPAADPAPAFHWVRQLVTGLPAHLRVTAGVSGECEVAELPAGRRESDECLTLHDRLGHTEAVCYDDSWHQVLLQRLRSAAATGRIPARGPVARLAGHDAAHGTELLPTLRAWLEAQGDLARAAAALDVHQNTVRNRLRRVTAAVPGLDLTDPARRLAMLIALAVHE
ncbi:helix-turn-helix domain-containing protein [Amycolatopsis thermalba]|uniref:Helix-turn-helix domain-containing protein n=1 Tax=Amycolatopsis thermalba TaxID=944492 RepID=A0ABY4NV65_9PSEU|nr:MULTISPECIES: helix-turn-helix domain-containing protein [Amycolatopsis]OXM72659.1 PucR family transcriptional regulator [Amycolatopsis sp. KNN50.9b]UQS23960.1 helix-turn-helix domain-containing protein [Amycolatopsis thermalba]